MTMDDEHRIKDVAELRTIVREPPPGVELKVYDHLPKEAVSFIGDSPFVVLSTSDAEGNVDASPKGDDPGFVAVADERTLLLPDRNGNNLAYGLQNILANPHVGMLFMIPGTTETLRVNGRAELRRDPHLLERLAARQKLPKVVVKVEVDEVFFHCSKAFLRSQLWKPDTWPEKRTVSFGKMFAERLGRTDDDLAATIDASVEEDARVNL